MDLKELEELDRRRRTARAIVWTFLILFHFAMTAIFTWMVCWSFGIPFCAKYVIGAWVISMATRIVTLKA